jgi:hypothetical protein
MIHLWAEALPQQLLHEILEQPPTIDAGLRQPRLVDVLDAQAALDAVRVESTYLAEPILHQLITPTAGGTSRAQELGSEEELAG